MIRDMKFQIKNGRLHNGGVSFGYGDSDPYIVEMGKRYILFRDPGSKDWQCLGSTTYYPAKWEIWEFEKVEAGVIRAVKQIEERQPGRFWQKAKTEMLERLHQLEKRK